MRVDLNTPFAEKDEAKSLGARWDATRRVWYIQNIEDLTPFLKWIPESKISKESIRSKIHENNKINIDFESKKNIISPPLKVCNCDVLPWEDCPHTL